MELTPIKITGKNKRDNRKVAIAERKALVRCPNRCIAAADFSHQKRPRGRPFKLPTHNAGSEASALSVPIVKKAKKRTLQNIKSKRKMSLLEKLPTELLEKVFLYCMNLELPRASPVISGKLSSETIYLHTLVGAFSPTWDKWHGQRETFMKSKGKGQASINDVFEGDPKLQVRKIYTSVKFSYLYCPSSQASYVAAGRPYLVYWEPKIPGLRENA